jgi:hypothetical protein
VTACRASSCPPWLRGEACCQTCICSRPRRGRNAGCRCQGSEEIGPRNADFRSSLDIVAKVENRATRKISRKLIFGLLRRCVAFQDHHGGPWSILDETMWSLTSPLAKRISGSKNFRLSPQKDFCNNIPSTADIRQRGGHVRKVPVADSCGATWLSIHAFRRSSD